MKHSKLVDWPTLREWCLNHGAKNDRITLIRIDGQGDKFNVVMQGNELTPDGRPYVEGLTHDLAQWRSVQRLRSLP